MSTTSGELGIALGIAIIGRLGTAVYRGRLTDHMPAHVPPSAASLLSDAQDSYVGGGLGHCVCRRVWVCACGWGVFVWGGTLPMAGMRRPSR